jgi:1-acyl-sn-glycerol-3-phosphate acyltransferase
MPRPPNRILYRIVHRESAARVTMGRPVLYTVRSADWRKSRAGAASGRSLEPPPDSKKKGSMLRSLPSPLRTAIGLAGVVLNTFFWTTLLFAVTALKLLLPSRAARNRLAQVAANIAQNWIGVNNWLIHATQRVDWVVHGLEGLDPRGWYLVLSNHLSELDIPVLQKVFHRRIPFIRFFLKQNLIWVPVLGQAWWALDYPFMKRHSAEAIARNPAKRLEDLETTRRALDKFKDIPTAILNYVEGTRLTPEKHAAQGSEFRNLLKPKAGGIAYALEAMGNRFHALLDVTIFYPDGDVTVMDLARGRVRRIVVDVKQRSIPHEFLEGDYHGDAAYRERFKAWLNEIWEEKDALLDQLKQQYAPAPEPAQA